MSRHGPSSAVGRFDKELLGVSNLVVGATIGPESLAWEKRERRPFDLNSLRGQVPCPNRCNGGGYDLVGDLSRAVERQRTEAQGILRCRGYVDAGGRRKACDHTLAYRARIQYDARRF